MRIAIVGSGVSGLSALWLLKQYSDHEVNIYEKNSFAGGHAHSAEFRRDGKEPCFVDTGFMSFHPRGSPNLLRFFKLLGVPLVQTDASLSVSRQGQVQWATRLGRGFRLTNILNPRAWRTAFDAMRFNYYAGDYLLEADEGETQITLEEYLNREGYSRGFFDDYLFPLIAVLLLVPDDQTALSMPAATVIATLADHNMLKWKSPHGWLSVEGGAKTYVDAIVSTVPPENLHFNTEIVSITSESYGVRLVEASGANHIYDHVILATPSNNSLAMLRRGGWASPLEETVLGSTKWTPLEAELHWDDKVAGSNVPNDDHVVGGTTATGRTAITAINYDAHPAPPPYNDEVQARTEQVSVTFDMNKIQGLSLDKHGPVRLTLNPSWPAEPTDSEHPEHPSRTGAQRWATEFPHQTATTIPKLRHLPEIQSYRRISYTGSWAGCGRHEDGFAAAYALVTGGPFNANAPFALEYADGAALLGLAAFMTQDSGADADADAASPNGSAATESTALLAPSAASVPRRKLKSKKSTGKLAIALMDATRRSLVSPLWPLFTWPVVLALAIAERVMRPFHRGATLAELKRGWQG